MGQDGAKMGQAGAKLAPRWAKMPPSFHLREFASASARVTDGDRDIWDQFVHSPFILLIVPHVLESQKHNRL